MLKDAIQPSRTRSSYLAAVVALALVTLGAPAASWAKSAAEAAASPSMAREHAVASARELSNDPPPSLDDTYAAREAKSKNLEAFKGGDVVIIGSTTVIIVLLIVLIVVLV